MSDHEHNTFLGAAFPLTEEVRRLTDAGAARYQKNKSRCELRSGCRDKATIVMRLNAEWKDGTRPKDEMTRMVEEGSLACTCCAAAMFLAYYESILGTKSIPGVLVGRPLADEKEVLDKKCEERGRRMVPMLTMMAAAIKVLLSALHASRGDGGGQPTDLPGMLSALRKSQNKTEEMLRPVRERKERYEEVLDAHDELSKMDRLPEEFGRLIKN